MLRATYPFSSSTTILTCQKNYISTQFKLLNYIFSFQLYQKYLFESTVLFTQYILTPVNPLNTIYQIIYFNILWVCWLLVYTCKPLLYTKKLKERCYFHSVQQSYENNSCKPEIKYFTVVNHQFIVVNCQFTVVKCQFTVVHCWFTVDYSKTSSDEVWV